MLHILCLALVLWLICGYLIVQQVGFISGVMFPYLLTTHLFLHFRSFYSLSILSLGPGTASAFNMFSVHVSGDSNALEVPSPGIFSSMMWVERLLVPYLK